MTEEIIVDGVDVSECNFRLERNGKQKCECCHATGFGVICACESWKGCYYKQLKRLEQENKRLKEELKEVKESFECQRNAYKKLNSMYMENCEYTGKLEQTLQEIKAIAEEWINNEWSCFLCRSNMDEKLKDILDLITKAEEE